MAAWGPGAFDNELATDYIKVLVETQISPIIIEPVTRDTEFLKHKLAYYYDRFRAAVAMMILLENMGYYRFAKGYYQLAIEKLSGILADGAWFTSWGGYETGQNTLGLSKRGKNYAEDIKRQLAQLLELESKARE